MEWGEIVFWAVITTQSIDWLIRLNEYWFGDKAITFRELHSILWDHREDLEKRIANLADPIEIKNIVLDSELRLRDRIKEINENNK